MTLNPKFRPWLRRAMWLLGSVALLFVVGYVFRAPLLIGLAQAWVVDQPVAHADAIVILGGGLENRPFAAAKMFRAGTSPQALYMNVRPGPAEELGVVLSEAEITRRILLSNGVPETAMAMIGNGVGSTFDESGAVRNWASTHDVRSILIPTDLFHTRRVAWLFRKQFHGSDVAIHVQAIAPLRYNATNWWQCEEGLIAFQNEVIKSAYYHFKY